MTKTLTQLMIDTLKDTAQDNTLPEAVPQLFTLAAAEIDRLQLELAEIRLLVRGRGRGRDKATLESIELSITRAIGEEDPPSMAGWGDYKATFHPADDDPATPDPMKLPYHVEQVLLADDKRFKRITGPLTAQDRMRVMMAVTAEQIKRARRALGRTQARAAAHRQAVPEGVL